MIISEVLYLSIFSIFFHFLCFNNLFYQRTIFFFFLHCFYYQKLKLKHKKETSHKTFVSLNPFPSYYAIAYERTLDFYTCCRWYRIKCPTSSTHLRPSFYEAGLFALVDKLLVDKIPPSTGPLDG